MASDLALSVKRPQMISYFQKNVSSGLDTVSFHNGNAALLGTSSPESSLLSASSFSMAANCSGNKAGFCAGLLDSLTSQLDFLTKNAQMDAQKASLMLALNQKKIMNDPTGNILKGIMDNKEQSQDELKKYQEEIEHQIASLQSFNSDADMRFKSLKESAEQQEFMARNHYYLHNAKNANNYGTYSSNFNASNNNASSSSSSGDSKTSSSKLSFMGVA